MAVVIFLMVVVAAVVWQVRVAGAGAPTSRLGSPLSPAPQAAALFARVDWAKVAYPLDCAGLGVNVRGVRTGRLTGPASADAVVHVRCVAGAGSPPSGLFVFAAPGPAVGPGLATTVGPDRPRLLATLISPAADELVTGVTAAAGVITATGYAYSSPNVPQCCPDRTFTDHWRWTGSDFTRE